MGYIWLALAGGVAAFAHCLGMCGGFALHLGGAGSPAAVLGRQLLWHAGKTATYVFLGALAGFLGGWVTEAIAQPWIGHVLAYGAGGVMILMGLRLLGVLPTLRPARPGRGEGLLASLFGQFFRQPTGLAAFVLGLATGFLPCPIVVMFLALSLQSGSVSIGMATMAAMGAGTVWSLLLLGMTGHAVKLRLRRWAPAIGGMVVVVLGLTTVLRGTEAFHQVLGCPQHRSPGMAGMAGCECSTHTDALSEAAPCGMCHPVPAINPATQPACPHCQAPGAGGTCPRAAQPSAAGPAAP